MTRGQARAGDVLLWAVMGVVEAVIVMKTSVDETSALVRRPSRGDRVDQVPVRVLHRFLNCHLAEPDPQ